MVRTTCEFPSECSINRILVEAIVHVCVQKLLQCDYSLVYTNSNEFTEGTGSSLVQTTGEPATLSATQPVEACGTRGFEAASKSATSPVEAGMRVLATQPVEAPGAGTATPPVEAPGAGPEVQLTSTGSDSTQLDQSLTGGKSADITGRSESEEDLDS